MKEMGERAVLSAHQDNPLGPSAAIQRAPRSLRDGGPHHHRLLTSRPEANAACVLGRRLPSHRRESSIGSALFELPSSQETERGNVPEARSPGIQFQV